MLRYITWYLNTQDVVEVMYLLLAVHTYTLINLINIFIQSSSLYVDLFLPHLDFFEW